MKCTKHFLCYRLLGYDFFKTTAILNEAVLLIRQKPLLEKI
jgi:hypothetical protein